MAIQQMMMMKDLPASPIIGEPYEGGYYAGQIATGITGVPTYNLVVSPKATGEISGLTWSNVQVVTTSTSVIHGNNNTNILAALGTDYEAATWCKSLSIGGYTDWYLPARYEMEVLYYFLKATSGTNNTSYGANPFSVLPEPYNTNYTLFSPSISSSSRFQYPSGSEYLSGTHYWTSTQYPNPLDKNYARSLYFLYGQEFQDNKMATTSYTRAIRRVPV
jgi:hypothetical protein